MNKKNLKPGYKKTAIGIIPEDWEVKKLISQVYVDKENLNSDFANKFIDYVSLSDIENGKISPKRIEYKTAPSRARRITKKGDVLLATVRPNLKNFAIVDRENIIASTGFAVLGYKKMNPGFLFNFLFSNLAEKQFFAATVGSSYPALNSNDVKNLKLPIPPLPEQKAIADCLSTWDLGIEKLTRLIDAKRLQKKGLMQQLLSGSIRLRSATGEKFSGEWEEVKIGEMGKVFTGNTPSKLDHQNWGEDFPWVTAEDMNEKYVFDTQVKLSKLGKKKARIAPAGSLLITCIASIGKNSITAIDTGFNQQINAIVVNSKHNNEFLYNLINHKNHKLIKYASPGSLKILNKNTFENIRFTVPSLAEQTAIAEVLQAADREIELLEQKLSALKWQKKGLTQVLLTGERRLI